MSDDYFVWSCPIKKITKCNVSPRLIESQFTVSTRRSFAIKRTESPLYHVTSKPNNYATFETKRDHATSRKVPVPKRRESKHGQKNKECDNKMVTTQKSFEIKNLKTIAIKKLPPRPTSKSSKSRTRNFNSCASQSIQTDPQGVLAHFNSLVDNIGTVVVDNTAPWIPYVGATALAIVLFGYFSKKMEKALCIYKTANKFLSKLDISDIPLLAESAVEEPPRPGPTPTIISSITVDPDTLRFHYNKLKWPLERETGN